MVMSLILPIKLDGHLFVHWGKIKYLKLFQIESAGNCVEGLGLFLITKLCQEEC